MITMASVQIPFNRFAQFFGSSHQMKFDGIQTNLSVGSRLSVRIVPCLD